MNKTWQICAVLVAIFAAGGVSGGLVAYRVARRHPPRPPPPNVWVLRQFDHFARELELTPDQRRRIKPILERNIQELTDLRRQSMRTGHDILDRMDTQIAAELTPDQRAKFEQIVKERRERWRQLQEHGGRGGPGGGPGGPPPAKPPSPPDGANHT